MTSFGRVYRVFRISRRHLLYRGLVAATLINAALLIGAHIAINPPHTDVTQAAEQQQKPDVEPFIDRLLNDPASVINLFVAFGTLCLVYVTYRLVDSTILLWQTGERQIAYLRESSARQLRAYVHVKDTPLEIYKDDATGLVAKVFVHAQWKNTGLTPALNCRMWIIFRPFPNDRPIDIFFQKTEDGEQSILGPTFEIGSGTVDFSFESIHNLFKGTIRAFLWFYIE